MAVRVVVDDVEVLLGSSIGVSDSDIEVFITAANALVNKIFSDGADAAAVGDTLLKEIERWLTAHLIASSRIRSLSKEKVGDVDVTYTGKFGEGLSMTEYGQMVLQLDPTGRMQRAGKQDISITAIESFDD